MKTYMAVLASIVAIVAIMGGIFMYKVSMNSSPERYFQKGKRNFELANYEEAINNFNEYLSIQSKSVNSEKPSSNAVESQFLIADSLKRMKKYSLAKERLAMVINDQKFSNYTPRAIIAYADICRLENYADAYIIGKLQQYLQMPNDKSLQFAMNMEYGYQMFFEKRYGEALSYFLRSDGELAVLGRARVYFNMGEYDRAFEVYEDFIKYYPSSEYYNEVVRTYLIQVPARAHLLYVSKNYAKARLYYEKIASLFPRTEASEDALFKIGESYFNEQNYNKAIEYYNRVRANNVYTLDAEALLYIGISYFKMDRFEDSYKILDSFVSQYPGNPNAKRAEEYMAALREILLAIN